MWSAASKSPSGQDTFWDQQPETSATNAIVNARPPRKKAAAVLDDWDADDDGDDRDVDVDASEEEKKKVGDGFPEKLLDGVHGAGDTENKSIWEAANAVAPAPKIDFVAGTSLGPGAFVPPPEAFQAPIRILKRPDDRKESASPGTKVLSKEEQERQLKDKQAEYLKARNRIFAASSVSVDADAEGATARASATQQGAGESSQGVKVIRNPKGPSPGNDSAGGHSRGFGGKRGRRREKKNSGTKE